MKKSEEYFSDKSDRISNIADSLYDEESKKSFLKYIDFRKSHRIKDRPPYYAGEWYFNDCLPTLSDEEVYVDGGGYIGDTIDRFLKYTGGAKKIIAFEPDAESFAQMSMRWGNKKDIYLFKSGLWSKSTELSFGNSKGQGNSVDGSEITISVVSMDEIEECHDATIIKLTVEGAEVEALVGAKKIINRNRPIIIASIYHNDKNVLEVPEWLISNCSNYRFLIRHQSYTLGNVFIYAIPNERLSI